MSDAGRAAAVVLIDGSRAECPRVTATDSRQTPVGRATLEVDRAQFERIVLRKDAVVSVQLGYHEVGLTEVFGGRIHHVEPRDSVVQVVALDAMATLERKRVRRAWTNATLAEALGSALDECLVPHDLSSTSTRRARHFVSPNLTLLQLFGAARATWGVQDWDLWADLGGRVWFGPWAETARASAEPVGDLVYGQNLLSFEPSTLGRGVAEALMAPALQHSRRVRLWHRELWEGALTVRIDRATHLWRSGEVAKTRIEWTLPS